MKRFNLIFIFLFSAVSYLHSQSPDVLENQYRLVNQSILKERAALDSLNRLMENTAKEIEREKKISEPDEKKIVKWMAHAVTISNLIKDKQKTITAYEGSADETRDRLEKVYTRFIDSLKQVENSPNYSGDRETLQNMILIWTEKRVMISPAVRALSFDPVKVREIDLKTAADPLGRILAEDYLKKALDEIDTHLSRLSASRREYEDLANLRRRTADFVSEAYEQGRLSTFTRSQTIATVTGADVLGNPIGFEYTTIQVRSVVGLIQQLNAGTALIQPTPVSSKSGMTQAEYIQLLKQAEKQLRSYRDLVQKKLK
jgi:hypothetical protein